MKNKRYEDQNRGNTKNDSISLFLLSVVFSVVLCFLFLVVWSFFFVILLFGLHFFYLFFFAFSFGFKHSVETFELNVPSGSLLGDEVTFCHTDTCRPHQQKGEIQIRKTQKNSNTKRKSRNIKIT